MRYIHQPVLLQSIINGLKVKPKGRYLDATVGSAGHSVEIVQKGGEVFGFDVDPEAIKRAKTRLSTIKKVKFHLNCQNFADKWDLPSLDGILFDLGLSSDQLADKVRGFSFQTNSPLDMRADPNLKVTAADLVNGLNLGELVKLFQTYGQEPKAKAITKSIINNRPITTTDQLIKAILKVKAIRPKAIHPATLVFQALRIAVNDELNNLKTGLKQAVNALKPGGRLAVISFHSLEDRIVKNYFKNNKQLEIITKKPIIPSLEEKSINPRARSAKLRIAEKK